MVKLSDLSNTEHMCLNKSQDTTFNRRCLLETIIPLSKRVLIRKDESIGSTRGGIILPDSAKIPTITARIVELSYDADPLSPLKKYDKVLVNPGRAIPASFEGDNKLYIVPQDDIIAIFRKIPQDADAEIKEVEQE